MAAEFIARGSPAFRKVMVALFAAGFCTFALLYSVQPLLPEFSKAFHINAAESSLSLSLTTFVLGFAIPVAGIFSESRGRKRIMAAALFSSSILTLITAFASGWQWVLILRTCMGLTLSGIPAIAMAYLGEEMEPNAATSAMGLYIAGTAAGGMSGRLLTGVLDDLTSWRVALGCLGVLGFLSAWMFYAWLPRSSHFTAQPLRFSSIRTGFAVHLRDPVQRRLFAEAFLLMGSFVTVYNYIGYRLLAPPYSLSQATVAFIFILYLLGTASSAWVGPLVGRYGRRRMLAISIACMLLGVTLTLHASLAVIIVGIGLLTMGFFAAHAIASSCVGQQAQSNKALASSLYMLFYYMGGSLIGTLGGLAISGAAWPGVVLMVNVLLGIAYCILPALALPTPKNA
jgi:YNFM family putative membrane transporter